MNSKAKLSVGLMITIALITNIWFIPTGAKAHCDTMDGPVVMATRAALDKEDVTPVLKWVKQENEAKIREAFQKTLAVRSKGPEVKELADMYFFEMLVRLHRAGEGAPYTGLKPAGTDLNPAVLRADEALETDSVDSLVKLLTDAVAAGIRARFAEALQKKKLADTSVDAGREYVETYFHFVHYVERLHQDAATGVEHHEGE